MPLRAGLSRICAVAPAIYARGRFWRISIGICSCAVHDVEPLDSCEDVAGAEEDPPGSGAEEDPPGAEEDPPGAEEEPPESEEEPPELVHGSPPIRWIAVPLLTK